MTLNEMIYHRKSCRSFLGQPVDSETIEKILSFEMKPLYPEIKVRMDIVSRNQSSASAPGPRPSSSPFTPRKGRGIWKTSAFCSSRWICTCRPWAWACAGSAWAG